MIHSKKENKDFNSLLKLTNDWPQAVSNHNIVNINSEQEKINRADKLINFFFKDNINNKLFLDYGCGEGHVVKQASNKSKISVGYNLNNNFYSHNDKTCLISDDYNHIKNNAPYDIILFYDIIDHVKEEQIKIHLNNIHSLSDNNSLIYIRCHPWLSRHGGHLYRKFNFAYAHLIFTEDELQKIGLNLINHNMILDPINYYHSLFSEFKILKENIIKGIVEPFFFKKEIIKNRLINLMENQKILKLRMEYLFVDYILSIK